MISITVQPWSCNFPSERSNKRVTDFCSFSQNNAMKIIIFLVLFQIVEMASFEKSPSSIEKGLSIENYLVATCTGKTPCIACKNCSACRHCSVNLGKCGLCKTK